MAEEHVGVSMLFTTHSTCLAVLVSELSSSNSAICRIGFCSTAPLIPSHTSVFVDQIQMYEWIL